MISTCGYIFIECQLSNGTNITQWVFAANNTLCIKPTTTTTTTTTTTITTDNVGKESDITVSNNPSTKITPSNQTSSSTDVPFYLRRSTLMVIGIVLSLLLIGLMAAFVMVCAHKRRESSNARGGNDQELQYADVKRQQPSRDVQPQAEMGGYGQITFSAQTDKPPVGRGAVQRGQEVEYGEIKFAERPQQKNRLMGPSGSPQGAPQVEYGEIKFIERPRRAR